MLGSASKLACCLVAINLGSRSPTSGFVVTGGIDRRPATGSRNNYIHGATPATSANSESDDRGVAAEECTQCVRNIVLLSDSTGITVKSAIERILTQFDSYDGKYKLDEETGEECEIRTKVFSHIRTETGVAYIIKRAREDDAIVIFTLVDAELRAKTARMCELSGLIYVDLLGPLLDGLSGYFQKAPLGLPLGSLPRRVVLGDSYYRRVEAVEFTLKADDGAAPWLLSEADVVIVGVSRTGKTPLSVVLSQTMGLKVANVPLVLECPPPKELFSDKIDPKRVFCLTINPSYLQKIRTSRLERRGVRSVEQKFGVLEDTKSTYADRDYLIKDLKHARDLALRYNYTQIDVTGRSVEDTASYISEILQERFQDVI